MAIKADTKSWQVVVLLIAAVALWVVERWKPDLLRGLRDRPATPAEQVEKEGASGASGGNGKPAIVKGYEKYEGCSWVDHRQNDGDSFRLKMPDGRVAQFRLYFADTPESAFRSYGGGANNHDRIHQQARDMGVTDKEVVQIGVDAKKAVEKMLKGKPITLYTEWDDPFGDQRFHAFIEMPDGGWLHEWLVKEGLARVHTKGSTLPDGTPEQTQLKMLEKLERSISGKH